MAWWAARGEREAVVPGAAVKRTVSWGGTGPREAWEGGHGDICPHLTPRAREGEDGLQLRRVRWQRLGRFRAGVRDGKIGNKSSKAGAIPWNVKAPVPRRRPGQGRKPSVLQSRVAGRLGSGEVPLPERKGG